MTCVIANRKPLGLTVYLVRGSAITLHVGGVDTGTLRWATGYDGPALDGHDMPGTPHEGGLTWTLTAEQVDALLTASASRVQLVVDGEVLMAGPAVEHHGWSGDCKPFQSVTYVAGGRGPDGASIDSITADGDELTVTLTDGTTRTVTIPVVTGVGIVDVTAEGTVLTVTLTDGTERTITLPVADPLPAPTVTTDGTRLIVDGEPTGEPIGGLDGVGIAGVTGDGQTMTVTLTDATEHPVALPVADVPAITTDGTHLLVDGQATGEPIRGEDAEPPTVSWAGDVLTVGGESSPPLTGPASTVPGPPGPPGGPIPAGGTPGQYPTPLAGGGYGWTDAPTGGGVLDTGWRLIDISALTTGYTLRVTRRGTLVTAQVSTLQGQAPSIIGGNPSSLSGKVIWRPPAGFGLGSHGDFSPARHTQRVVAHMAGDWTKAMSLRGALTIERNTGDSAVHRLWLALATGTTAAQGTISWECDDPMPSSATLPGTPITPANY